MIRSHNNDYQYTKSMRYGQGPITDLAFKIAPSVLSSLLASPAREVGDYVGRTIKKKTGGAFNVARKSRGGRMKKKK